MSQIKITGIILAAGSSKRMGDVNKLLYPLNGTSIIEHSLNNLSQAKLDEVILLLGHDAEAIAALPLVTKLRQEKKLKIVINKNYAHGMGTSLAVGVNALSEDTDACLIALGDMPFVSAETIDKIIDAGKAAQEKAIIVPQFNGQNGHPVMWKKQFFSELCGLNQDQGAKHIIANNQAHLLNVEVADEGIVQDLDTAEMLEKLNK